MHSLSNSLSCRHDRTHAQHSNPRTRSPLALLRRAAVRDSSYLQVGSPPRRRHLPLRAPCPRSPADDISSCRGSPCGSASCMCGWQLFVQGRPLVDVGEFRERVVCSGLVRKTVLFPFALSRCWATSASKRAGTRRARWGPFLATCGDSQVEIGSDRRDPCPKWRSAHVTRVSVRVNPNLQTGGSVCRLQLRQPNLQIGRPFCRLVAVGTLVLTYTVR